MKVKEIQSKLQRINPEAEVQVIVENFPQKFSLSIGDQDGCTDATCRYLSFYVDSLNSSEKPKAGGSQ